MKLGARETVDPVAPVASDHTLEAVRKEPDGTHIVTDGAAVRTAASAWQGHDRAVCVVELDACSSSGTRGLRVPSHDRLWQSVRSLAVWLSEPIRDHGDGEAAICGSLTYRGGLEIDELGRAATKDQPW